MSIFISQIEYKHPHVRVRTQQILNVSLHIPSSSLRIIPGSKQQKNTTSPEPLCKYGRHFDHIYQGASRYYHSQQLCVVSAL